eukprot:2402622-Alexandrium_andersonii.AAC.1
MDVSSLLAGIRALPAPEASDDDLAGDGIQAGMEALPGSAAQSSGRASCFSGELHRGPQHALYMR